jgi:hypothetical protein
VRDAAGIRAAVDDTARRLGPITRLRHQSWCRSNPAARVVWSADTRRLVRRPRACGVALCPSREWPV